MSFPCLIGLNAVWIYFLFLLLSSTGFCWVQAEKAVLAEEARLKQYLHEGSSREPLLTEVLHELVAVPLEPLMAKETGAEQLFKNRNPDGTAQLF